MTCSKAFLAECVALVVRHGVLEVGERALRISVCLSVSLTNEPNLPSKRSSSVNLTGFGK